MKYACLSFIHLHISVDNRCNDRLILNIKVERSKCLQGSNWHARLEINLAFKSPVKIKCTRPRGILRRLQVMLRCSAESSDDRHDDGAFGPSCQATISIYIRAMSLISCGRVNGSFGRSFVFSGIVEASMCFRCAAYVRM